MAAQLVWYGFVLLVAITVIAIGSYIGTMRALDRFHAGKDSIFLSGDTRGDE
ncbi:hypothetical protein LPA44_04475 [Halobacterium sp. KA-4]|jgi:hypothetical protein|uniref:hypothetical protein n=1 Tax=Halobacterium sp. KA-4 TaxID=2896367 RepID=UPI001E4E3252|nr:hypothetical protein [Halobacterium sp. KA-4]MCD2199155.1 hypothetical protein [Halobacterium sp. KA-4]